MFTIAPGSKDPSVTSNVIRSIIQSTNCQAYQEKDDYMNKLVALAVHKIQVLQKSLS